METTNQQTPYQLYIGIDRSDATLDISIMQPTGESIQRCKISTKPDALLTWVQSLRTANPDGQIAICIEQPCANIASFLSQFDFIDLFLINPILIKNYRDSFHTARPKDDKKDADSIANFLRERHHKLTLWHPASVQIRQLRSFLEHRRSLVDQVTEITNRLTSTLKIYYPLALEISGQRLHAPLACRFLERFPDLETLQATEPGDLRAFYYSNQSRRKPLIEKRITAATIAIPITTDPGLIVPGRELVQFLISQLDLLRPQIEHYENLIDAIKAEHKDTEIFESLPGAGPNLSARLLATFGDDRTRFLTAESIQRYTGIAPVTKQSGKKRYVHRRFTKRTCPHFEHQTFIEWVGQSILQSTWARAYYDDQRKKKIGHWAIMRALAYKWIRILHRCWKDRTKYDEEKYIKALERAGSPVAALINKAA